jgi:DNA-binding response OmpR family regulator
VRVLVVEDDAIVAETLTVYLEQAGYDVVVARDGPSGLTRASAGDIGVVILDLMIPGISGLDVCRHIRATSSVPIVMLTARTSEDDRLAGFDCGADDYVPKPFSPREVVARVRALLRRAPDAEASPPLFTIGDLELNSWAHAARIAGEPLALTPTEFKLLAALARQPGRVFSRADLVARIFGPDYDGLDRTVDVHITNLRRKISDGLRTARRADRGEGYVVTVHGVGYRLATADEI